MLSIPQELSDLTLEVKGASTLVANQIAGDVDRYFNDAWDRWLRGGPDSILTHALFAGVEPLIADRLHKSYVLSWNLTANGTARALPAGLLHGLELLRRLGVTEGARELLELEEGAARKLTAKFHVVKKKSAKALFVPPSEAEIQRAIYTSFKGATWDDRLKAYDTSSEIGVEIERAVAKGLSREDIARLIQPLVDGPRWKAMRIARTETHRVMIGAQMNSQRDALGPMFSAWRYRATLDEKTRPDHAADDGKVFAEDDPGFVELPRDPNCRCGYQAVTKGQDTLSRLGLDRLLTPKERESVDGPVRYQQYPEWFDNQSEARQRRILGDRFFERVADGGKAKWTDVVQARGQRTASKHDAKAPTIENVEDEDAIAA